MCAELAFKLWLCPHPRYGQTCLHQCQCLLNHHSHCHLLSTYYVPGSVLYLGCLLISRSPMCSAVCDLWKRVETECVWQISDRFVSLRLLTWLLIAWTGGRVFSLTNTNMIDFKRRESNSWFLWNNVSWNRHSGLPWYLAATVHHVAENHLYVQKRTIQYCKF